MPPMILEHDTHNPIKKYTFEQLKTVPVGTFVYVHRNVPSLDLPPESFFDFVVKRGFYSLCAFIGVSMSSPFAGRGLDFPIECHYGLSYASQGDDAYLPSSHYWYGWDYSHFSDAPLTGGLCLKDSVEWDFKAVLKDSVTGGMMSFRKIMREHYKVSDEFGNFTATAIEPVAAIADDWIGGTFSRRLPMKDLDTRIAETRTLLTTLLEQKYGPDDTSQMAINISSRLFREA